MKLKFNQLMKEARKEKGLSQREAAALCGLSEMMYRQYELGNRKPKQDNLAKIMNGLGLSWAAVYPDMPDGRQSMVLQMLDDSGLPVKGEAKAAEPADKVTLEVTSLDDYIASQLHSIAEDMGKLNEKGRAEAARRVHELTFIPIYVRKLGSDSEKGDG